MAIDDSEHDLYLTLALRTGSDREAAKAIAERMDKVTRNRAELIELSSRALSDRLQAATALAFDATPNDRPSEEFIIAIANMLRDEIGQQAMSLAALANGQAMKKTVGSLVDAINSIDESLASADIDPKTRN
jgi:hypothetical protein